jgi:hypothetical protein
MPNTFELIASSTVGSGGAASIDFTSIAASWTDLFLVHSCRVNDTGNADMVVQFNGDTGANYSFRRLNSSGIGVTSDAGSSNALFGLAGLANGTSSTASTFGNTTVYIPNYKASTTKSISYDSVVEINSATGNNLALGAAIWTDTAAITSIKLRAFSGNNFLQHSTAYLYGVKNA